jgi:hypothetical protein
VRSVDPDTIEVKDLVPHISGVAYAVSPLPDGSGAVLAGTAGELRIAALDAIKP